MWADPEDGIPGQPMTEEELTPSTPPLHKSFYLNSLVTL
jgi:hypothetical protein